MQERMRILKGICRWPSSGLIGLVVSCAAFTCISIVYARFELQDRLGVDDDVCWLALVVGPALIVVIHRSFHKRVWIAVATLTAGLALAGLGVFQFMWAREARTHHHVPSGPFSGIEHDFAIVLSFFTMLVAAPAILGSFLALAARLMNSDAESCARVNAASTLRGPDL